MPSPHGAILLATHKGPNFWGSTLDTVDSLFYQLLKKPSLYFLLTILKLFDKQSVI